MDHGQHHDSNDSNESDYGTGQIISVTTYGCTGMIVVGVGRTTDKAPKPITTNILAAAINAAAKEREFGSRIRC
jgi:hypothetical protein